MTNPSPTTPPVIDSAKQKLVTIYLDNTAYAAGKTFVGSFADKHGFVEEHLSSLIAQGWRIAKLESFGGNSEGLAARGWVIVLLEKE